MNVQREMMRSTTRFAQLAKMSLEELLYYVLVGERRVADAPAKT